jgi:ribonuclease P protein component
LEELSNAGRKQPKLVKRRFRLTKSSDFKRVRRMGKSYAHPLIVLVTHPNEHERARVAVAAGRSIGNAVQRNRAKRRLREAIRPLIPLIEPGWDLLILARHPLPGASFQQCQEALADLLKRARLLKYPHGD